MASDIHEDHNVAAEYSGDLAELLEPSEKGASRQQGFELRCQSSDFLSRLQREIEITTRFKKTTGKSTT